MFFVEGSFLIKGVMKFVTGNPCVAGGVQVAYKFIYQVEKVVFPGVVVFAVEPVNHVASC